MSDQHNNIYKSISAIYGANINYGYWLTNTGTLYEYDKAAYTDKIYVFEGMNIEILTDAYMDATAYILYNYDGSIYKYETYDKSTYARLYNITIPAGVNAIQCSCVNIDNGFTVKIHALGADRIGIIPDIHDSISNHDQTIKNICNTIGNTIKIYKGIGYVTKNNGIDANQNCKYAKTDIINVAEGDIFLYKGIGEYDAYSVIFFCDKNIISSLQIKSESSFTEVTIPSGVNKVLFATYNAYKDEYPELGIIDKRPTIINRVSNLENNQPTNSNILNGKLYYVTGDSFTEGDFSGYVDENGNTGTASDVYDAQLGCYKTYPWWIAKRNNMQLVNDAKCGSILALDKRYVSGESTDINLSNPYMNTRYLNIPNNADYIIIAFGLNDMYKTNLGTITDETVETFYGAFNVLFEYLLTNYPHAKIGTIVMNSYMSESYATAIKESSSKWGIPCLDMMYTKNVNTFMPNGIMCAKAKKLKGDAFYVSLSNTHPNLKAHELESTVIENFLRSL